LEGAQADLTINAAAIGLVSPAFDLPRRSGACRFPRSLEASLGTNHVF
jgi:hypothetical protein